MNVPHALLSFVLLTVKAIQPPAEKTPVGFWHDILLDMGRQIPAGQDVHAALCRRLEEGLQHHSLGQDKHARALAALAGLHALGQFPGWTHIAALLASAETWALYDALERFGQPAPHVAEHGRVMLRRHRTQIAATFARKLQSYESRIVVVN